MTEQHSAGPGQLFAFGEQASPVAEAVAAPDTQLNDMAYRAGPYDRRKAIVSGKPISKRQSAYYLFIHRYMTEHHGDAPTFSEIGRAMGVTSVAAFHVVGRLERNGWLTVDHNKKRGIALATPFDPAGRAEPACGERATIHIQKGEQA